MKPSKSSKENTHTLKEESKEKEIKANIRTQGYSHSDREILNHLHTTRIVCKLLNSASGSPGYGHFQNLSILGKVLFMLKKLSKRFQNIIQQNYPQNKVGRHGINKVLTSSSARFSGKPTM